MYIVFINISTASDSLAVLFYCISPSCYAGGFRYTIAAASDKPAPCFSPLIPALDFSQKLLTRTPLTPCLTYSLMPTIIFLRIICRVIGGACGEIFGTMLGQMADGNASVQNPASDRNRIKMADRYRQIFRCRHRSDRLRSRILGFGNKKTVETA